MIDQAIDNKVIDPYAKAIMHSAEKFGFSYMRNAANVILQLSSAQADIKLSAPESNTGLTSDPALVRQYAKDFISSLSYFSSQFNGENNQFELERRGTEVHINLAKSSQLS